MAEQSRPAPTKAYHRKVKTGCLTCKIRRVRCDQQKPACNRCVSTGRKCDGYAQPATKSQSTPGSSSSSSTSPSAPESRQLQIRPRRLSPASPSAIASVTPTRILLPHKDPDELQVYSYFLQVAAPSISGVFGSEFWLREVPRFCLSDPAIWHAVAALGTVCRDYDFRTCSTAENVFAMRQIGTSLQHLTQPRSASSMDRWRALIASVLFTCISVVQGSYSQALVHVSSGAKIFRELEDEDKVLRKGKGGTGRASLSPISFSSVRSVLITFQIQQSIVDPSDILGSPSIRSHDDSYSAWRTYSAPEPTAVPGHVLTPGNIVRATRAGEALIFGLSFFSALYFEEVSALVASGELQLPSIAAKQRSHLRCFKEIGKTVALFEDALMSASTAGGFNIGVVDGSSSSSSGASIRAHIEKALKYLRVYHNTCRLLLHRDPDEQNPIKRLPVLKRLSESIVDLCEELMDLEAAGYGNGDGTYLIPSPPLTNPLSMVALLGFGLATRRRAVALLRRPRLEGVWDTQLSASIVEASMERQMEARDEYYAAVEREGGTLPQPVVRGTGVEEVDNGVHPQFRSAGFSMVFTGDRSADVSIHIWRDVLDGKPPYLKPIEW
ncbi:unnamed protein product [Clonostachys byssicola]|uniref:Zn(2)-C6 fungal-type domain-containing protein n=1 Tax=Clonostachys byssicola TaxID=160290 RepID=A0A9N9Y352_9HYPO|nr:unnamed protein product [Clonostachys byssicola]